jgi:hypothetical protein
MKGSKMEEVSEEFVDALCKTYARESGMSAELDIPEDECVANLKHLLDIGEAMITVTPSPDGDLFTIRMTPTDAEPPAPLQ